VTPISTSDTALKMDEFTTCSTMHHRWGGSYNLEWWMDPHVTILSAYHPISMRRNQTHLPPRLGFGVTPISTSDTGLKMDEFTTCSTMHHRWGGSYNLEWWMDPRVTILSAYHPLFFNALQPNAPAAAPGLWCDADLNIGHGIEDRRVHHMQHNASQVGWLIPSRMVDAPTCSYSICISSTLMRRNQTHLPPRLGFGVTPISTSDTVLKMEE
jgi:hypothetical protein